MRPCVLAIALVPLLSLPALAALPPHYQRQAELMAVVGEATEALGVQRPIEAIEMVRPDFWVVRSGACTLELAIVDVPLEGKEPGFVGPRNFAVEAGPVDCGN
jgi:hypothetical protein